MKRLTITLEDYDASKVVRATLLQSEGDFRAATFVLGRSGVHFSIDEVNGEFYNYLLDDGDRYVDLALRTKVEINEWVDMEPFEISVRRFLESQDTWLRLSLDDKDSFLEVERIVQETDC